MGDFEIINLVIGLGIGLFVFSGVVDVDCVVVVVWVVFEGWVVMLVVEWKVVFECIVVFY